MIHPFYATCHETCHCSCADNIYQAIAHQNLCSKAHLQAEDFEQNQFLYQVSIPALPVQTIQPNKLCRTVEEAKIYAAEYTLMQLGIPIESELNVSFCITKPSFSFRIFLHFYLFFFHN